MAVYLGPSPKLDGRSHDDLLFADLLDLGEWTAAFQGFHPLVSRSVAELRAPGIESRNERTQQVATIEKDRDKMSMMLLIIVAVVLVMIFASVGAVALFLMLRKPPDKQ